MHADLVKLLDLQAKDAVVGGRRTAAGGIRTANSPRSTRHSSGRGTASTARAGAAAEGARRRDELEAKVESYRLLQDRRRLRLEHVRNPKEASTLMAELDLARSVMAKEENDWVRSAEAVTQLERKVERGGEQAWPLADVGRPPSGRGSRSGGPTLEAEREAATREREASAEQHRQAAPHPLRPAAAIPRRARSWCRWSAAPAGPVTPRSRSIAGARSGAGP